METETNLPCLNTPSESCSCPRSRGTKKCHGAHHHVQVEVVPPEPRKKGSKLWLWVVAACALQIAAWSAWFIIASHNRVQEVPLATKAARP